jgi:hypothetical protein
LKRVEVEEKKKKEEEKKRRKAEEEQRKKEEAKAALAATEVKKKVDVEKAGMEKGKKRDREDSVTGTRMVEGVILWYSQEEAVCDHCKKSREQCLWRNGP